MADAAEGGRRAAANHQRHQRHQMMASSVENPASSDDGLGAQLDDLESALAAAKAASSEPRTVEAMERLMDAKIALLEARLAKAAPFEGAINAVVARWTEAPTNWHQSTAYFAVLPREDEDAGRRWNAMLGGVLMVIAQCMAVVGLFVGTFIPSCMSNDQCEQKGTFCWLGRTDRCDKCGSATPLVVETGVNDPDAADFVGFNTTAVAEICRNPVDVVQINNGGFEDIYPRAAVASWCAACVHPLDMSVDPVTEQSVARAEFDAMATFDWIALLFAAFMVALAVIGELKDIELVDLAVRRAEDKLEQRWVLALRLLGGVRRWLFLPTLVMAVPFIVLMKGGDALSVCFNTVALLFLCDIDNLTYRILLNERLRTRVEVRGKTRLLFCLLPSKYQDTPLRKMQNGTGLFALGARSGRTR